MVHVIIKAANGAVDDFRVSGAASQWTVGQLKNYLYRHYPTHPVSAAHTHTRIQGREGNRESSTTPRHAMKTAEGISLSSVLGTVEMM